MNVNGKDLRGKTVQVAIVLDRSGSMEECRDETVSGFNEYVAETRKTARQEGLNARVTLVTFNDEVTPVYWSAPLDRLQPIDHASYVPGGTTAMLDAVGTTIDRLVGDEPDAEGHALVCIISDGLENASSEYTAPAIAKRIHHLQATGRWTFTYLGSNQDLAKVSADLGMPETNVAAYSSTPAGTHRAWEAHREGSSQRLRDIAVGAESRGFYAEDGVADLTGNDEEGNQPSRKQNLRRPATMRRSTAICASALPVSVSTRRGARTASTRHATAVLPASAGLVTTSTSEPIFAPAAL